MHSYTVVVEQELSRERKQKVNVTQITCSHDLCLFATYLSLCTLTHMSLARVTVPEIWMTHTAIFPAYNSSFRGLSLVPPCPALSCLVLSCLVTALKIKHVIPNLTTWGQQTQSRNTCFPVCSIAAKLVDQVCPTCSQTPYFNAHLNIDTVKVPFSIDSLKKK